jgi:hypothetical protein
VPVSVHDTEAGVVAVPSDTPYSTMTVVLWPAARLWKAGFAGSSEKVRAAAS